MLEGLLELIFLTAQLKHHPAEFLIDIGTPYVGDDVIIPNQLIDDRFFYQLFGKRQFKALGFHGCGLLDDRNLTAPRGFC